MGFFGFLLRAFKFRRKVTTRERLQYIDEELEKLDTRVKRNQQLQKSITVYLLTLSILIYIISIVIVYLWYFPVLWFDRFIYSLPFLICPLLVYLSKKLLHHIFINRIRNNANAAKELKKDKKKILETVMDTETYKVAKELLQKYDPNGSLVEETVSPVKATPKATSEGQELRRRNVPSGNSANKPPGPLVHSTTNGYPMTPAPIRAPSITMGSPVMRTSSSMMRGPVPTPRARVPIAPILPRERSVFDKVADYFIGDGPNNRFALICKQCYGHNGMVLAEEFEFTSYRCCYCTLFNPARKQRLNAPRLERTSLHNRTRTGSTNSTDVESSNKGDETDDKGDSSVENNTVFEEESSETKQSEETEENDDSVETSVETTDDPSDDKDSKEADTTDDAVSNDSNEKLETLDTDETKGDG